MIEVRRIASHNRLTDDVGQYQTIIHHMPAHHQKYIEDTADRYVEWSETVGSQMKILILKVIEMNVEKRHLIY